MSKIDNGDKGPTLENTYGEPLQFDPEFTGPVDNRKCTDAVCGIIFLACITTFLIFGSVGLVFGDPDKFLHPTDSQGNLCGVGNKKEKPFLLFFDLLGCLASGSTAFTNGCPTPQVCVEDCPKKNFSWQQVPSQGLTHSNLVCQYHVTSSAEHVPELVQSDKCIAYSLISSSVVERCIPDVIFKTRDQHDPAISLKVAVGVELRDKFSQPITLAEISSSIRVLKLALSAGQIAFEVISDFQKAWWLIFALLMVSMVASILWVELLTHSTASVVNFTVGLFIFVFLFTTTLGFYTYFKQSSELQNNPAGETYIRYLWLTGGILSLLVLLIIGLLLVYLRRRIRIAKALLESTSCAIREAEDILWWPIYEMFIQLCVYTFWLCTTIYLAATSIKRFKFVQVETKFSSSGRKINYYNELDYCDPVKDKNEANPCYFDEYGGNVYMIVPELFNLFMLFWMGNFIITVGQMVMVYVFCSYYWTLNKANGFTVSKTKALWISLRYHTGTMAFGSLVISVVALQRFILESIGSKIKDSENFAAYCMSKYCRCCFWCLDKSLKYVNKNAYIMTVLFGHNFHHSAKMAFNLIGRNLIRVAVVDTETIFVLNVGRLAIVGSMAFFSWMVLSGDIGEFFGVRYYIVPLTVVVIGTFVIASGFFNVYVMGVDTMYLCFLLDMEMNDGSPERPYHAPVFLTQAILLDKAPPPPPPLLRSKNFRYHNRLYEERWYANYRKYVGLPKVKDPKLAKLLSQQNAAVKAKERERQRRLRQKERN